MADDGGQLCLGKRLCCWEHLWLKRRTAVCKWAAIIKTAITWERVRLWARLIYPRNQERVRETTTSSIVPQYANEIKLLYLRKDLDSLWRFVKAKPNKLYTPPRLWALRQGETLNRIRILRKGIYFELLHQRERKCDGEWVNGYAKRAELAGGRVERRCRFIVYETLIR